MISISDVPQANSLKKVLLTTLAVYNGAQSYQQIAGVIGFTQRQARYYRRACELLGLVETKPKNKSKITHAGKTLLKEIKFDTNQVKSLGSFILQIPLVTEVLEYFENEEDVTEKHLLNRMIEVAGFKKNNATARRRLSTFIVWMKEIDLFKQSEGVHGVTKTFRLNKNLQKAKNHNLKIIDSYESFTENIHLNLIIPYETDIGVVEYQALDRLLGLLTVDDVEQWLRTEGASKVAHLLVFKSESEKVNPANILSEKEFLKSLELSFGRLLIETDRALRGLSSSIAKGGNALETLMASYCKSNKLDYKKNYLFKGLSKNVDFFIPELNLAIECKYSKSSGTKHGGALKDIREQSKGKNEHGYKLGVLIAGQQYIDDKNLCASIFELKKQDVLDLVITPSDLENLTPQELLICKRESVKIAELIVQIESETTWSENLNKEEIGLDDACRWLERFLSVDFLNFKSLLHTWISQTPFAVQVLRLIIGWSESKMSSFIKASVEEKNLKWQTNMESFKDISFLVNSLVDNLAEEEIGEVKRFFSKTIAPMDFLVARESALRGSAIRKQSTSKIFIQSCIENSQFEVIEENFTQQLPSGAKVKSNFKVKKNEKELHVLCKYYAGSGSVMSDFVKTMCELSEIGKHHEWIFIVDGPGWLDRQNDLNRMISYVNAKKLNFYNLSTWRQWKRVS